MRAGSQSLKIGLEGQACYRLNPALVRPVMPSNDLTQQCYGKTSIFIPAVDQASAGID